MYKKSRHGFTLMETLLAIAVVAVLLTTFLAVFGPATSGIRRAISVQDADRLASALEHELSTLRQDEIGTFNTAFDKAFQWVSDSGTLSNAVLLFNYRGSTTQSTNGQPNPFIADLGSPGRDYTVQSAVRRISSADDLQQFLAAVEGRSFVVRMSQLVRDQNGGLIPAPAGSPLVSSDGQVASDSSTFTDAVIAFQAEFFLLPANNFTYVNGPLAQAGQDFERALGNPLFTRNMAVLR